MWVIYMGSNVGLLHMLEASLISHYAECNGCQNMVGTGGEGALNKPNNGGPPYFAYVTGGRADQRRRVG